MNARTENSNECECASAAALPTQYDHHHMLIERDGARAENWFIKTCIRVFADGLPPQGHATANVTDLHCDHRLHQIAGFELIG